VSLDGYLDDATGDRLVLSNDADLDRVDAERAAADAILVGANTIRRDDPRLLVRSPARRAGRVRQGRAESPVKVTLTTRGELDPARRFFTDGDVEKVVYAASPALDKARERLGAVATVVDGGDPLGVERIVADLEDRGVGRLMVEGGGGVLTRFLGAGLADELQLVVAPFFVGDARAPRFVHEGPFPWRPGSPARLAEARPIGDVVLLRYALSARFPGS
jgi:5-amino-6-(5-phosphoribosylamino)uracil reductase